MAHKPESSAESYKLFRDLTYYKLWFEFFWSELKSAFCLGRLSLHTSLVAHHAKTYPGFCIMKQLGIFLLSAGWDARPSQGYPQH